jgi:phage protein D
MTAEIDRSVADISIKARGVEIAPSFGLALASVTVTDNLGEAGQFTIKWHLSEPNPPSSNDAPFALGAPVEIRLGWVGMELVLVIAGEVSMLEAEYDWERPAVLTVIGLDSRQRLLRNNQTKSFTSRTDSALFEEIVSNNQLTGQITPTDLLYDSVTQDDVQDLEFLQARAALYGYDLLLDGNTLYFGPPKPESISLTLGEELLTFSPSVDRNKLVGTVEMPGYDVEQGEEFNPSSTASHYPGTLPDDVFEPKTEQLRRDSLATEVTSQRRAQTEVADRAAQALSARGQCRGNPNLRAGQVVQVDGVGPRFSGPYRLTTVTHSFSPDRGFSTSFTATGSRS